MEIDVNDDWVNPDDPSDPVAFNKQQRFPLLPAHLPRLPSNRNFSYIPRKRVGDSVERNVFRPPTTPKRDGNVVNIKRK